MSNKSESGGDMPSNADRQFSEHNLIVNYLPQSLTNEELLTLFNSVGPVKMAKIIRNRTTGVSYGFGFVEYENQADAQKAINSLNGIQLQNKRIKVAIARQGENIKGANLYVKYLPKNYFAKDLEDLFGKYGTVIQARVLMDYITGLSRGIGFVLLSSRDEATKAKEELDGKAPPGHTQALSVKFAEENKVTKQQTGLAAVMPPTGLYRPFLPVSPPMQHMPSNIPLSTQIPISPVGRTPLLQQHQPPFVPGFGEGYQNNFGGGPVRSSLATQRFGAMPYRPVAPPNVPLSAESNGATSAPDSDGQVLFVYNIGNNTDERALWQLFSPFGAIKRVNVIRDYEKQQGKGYGFVTMFDYQEALHAIQHLNGFVFVDKPLQVSLKTLKGAK